MSKSNIVNRVIVVLILLGIGGILWTQSIIRHESKISDAALQAKITESTTALAQAEATDKAWREALAEYNRKIIVPQVIEPTPVPPPKETHKPIIRPAVPAPTATPKVIIIKTVRVKSKARPSPTPKVRPWYRRFDVTR
jgi:hypothetical protein